MSAVNLSATMCIGGCLQHPLGYDATRPKVLEASRRFFGSDVGKTVAGAHLSWTEDEVVKLHRRIASRYLERPNWMVEMPYYPFG